jgi:hypothetical protein
MPQPLALADCDAALEAAVAAQVPETLARFRGGTKLLRELTRRREYWHEILLVACCHIDAMAGLVWEWPPNRAKSFARMLSRHSGFGDLYDLVSLPDLYFYLASRWLLVPSLERKRKSGRLRAVRPLWDLDYEYYRFLKDSQLERSRRNLGDFLELMADALKTVGKCHPHQRRARAPLVRLDTLKRRLRAHFAKLGGKQGIRVITALFPVVERFSLAGILWHEYRNPLVHTPGDTDPPERFYTARGPVFETIWNPTYETPFLRVIIPAPFIIRTVQNCIAACREICLQRPPAEVLASLPPDVWESEE